ncbi:hypothetical protein niasHT_017844 [Heterodera trifolii]|uniref:Uncharacterized protein n=1 Tax=Heterodera trifolii TaxID=157864 RepID=A0ABD2LKF5_9BILA
MDLSFNSEKTPPKRAKRSPIQRLKAGETMIVELELRAQEGSTVTIVTKTDYVINGITKEMYFDFLGSKLALNETNFMPSKIENLRKGEKFIEVEAKLMRVQPVREVMVKGSEANVIDFDQKEEITLQSVNIDCNDAGVLTLTIYDNGAYKTHTEKTIQTHLSEVDYPPTE